MAQQSYSNSVPSSDLDAIEFSNLTDAELVASSRDNPAAFAHLFERYYELILNYTFRRTLNVELAEELTAITFFKALRSLDSYSDQGVFKAWLFHLATNEIRMNWRSNRNRQKYEREYGNQVGRVVFQDNPAQDHVNREQQLGQFVQLHEALTQLPDRYQTALTLRYFEGLSLDETAQAMNSKTGTVKSLVHRGIKRLRSIFENTSVVIDAIGPCRAQDEESKT